MSVTMHLRQISDADAARYRLDPALVLTATLGSELSGRPSPAASKRLFELGGFDMPRLPGRGLFGGVKSWLVQRAVRAALNRQVEQLRRAHAAMEASPAGQGVDAIPAPGDIVDLHKSWQMLHFVLTGTPDSGPTPLNILLVGGEAVGDDLGYGPARIVDPRAIRDFAKALSAFDLDMVIKRLDVGRMAAAGVYCVDRDDDREAQAHELEEDMRQSFPALKAFAEKASAARQGALIWLS